MGGSYNDRSNRNVNNLRWATNSSYLICFVFLPFHFIACFSLRVFFGFRTDSVRDYYQDAGHGRSVVGIHVM
jgi:hypothetical protein